MRQMRWLAVILSFCVILLSGCGERTTQAAFREGIRGLDKGKYTQSARLFLKAIDEGPDNATRGTIYNYLGICYSKLDQQDQACAAFEMSMRLNPNLVAPVYNLGVLMLAQEDVTNAVSFFEKATSMDPNETRALEFLAQIHAKNRRWHQSRAALNEAMKRTPRSPRILTASALLELEINNVDQAITFLNEALAHDAYYPPAIYNLAVVNHRWLKNDTQAAAFYRDYIRVSPDSTYAEKARSVLKELSVPASPAAATSNVPAGVSSTPTGPVKPKVVVEPTKSVLRAAPARQPTSVKPVSDAQTFKEWLRVAGVLEQQGRREAAVNNFIRVARQAERVGKQNYREQAIRGAVAACGDDPRANSQVGLYFLEKKQNAKAMQHLKRATQCGYNAQLALGKVAIEEGEFDTALVSLKQAGKSGPDQPEALWLLARLYDGSLNLTNQSIQCYHNFIRRFPGDPRVDIVRQRLAFLKGGVKESETKASAVNPWWKRF